MQQIATIQCPDVGQKLTDVPDGARAGVDKELASLDKQITEAYTRLASTRQAQAGDASFVKNAILGPLKSKRTAAIDRIGINIKRVGGQAPDDLAQHGRVPGHGRRRNTNDGQAGGDQNQDGQNQGGQNQGGQDQGGQDQGGRTRAVRTRAVRIRDRAVTAARAATARQPGTSSTSRTSSPTPANLPNGLASNGDGGSTGTFTTNCGINENGNRNSTT